MQGRLGHQVLGQLLITGMNDAAIAVAAVAVAGTTRSRNAAVQIATRTAAPAIAVHALLQREENRISRLDALVRRREATVSKREHERRDLQAKVMALEGEKARLLAGRVPRATRNSTGKKPRAKRATSRRKKTGR